MRLLSRSKPTPVKPPKPVPHKAFAHYLGLCYLPTSPDGFPLPPGQYTAFAQLQFVIVDTANLVDTFFIGSCSVAIQFRDSPADIRARAQAVIRGQMQDANLVVEFLYGGLA